MSHLRFVDWETIVIYTCPNIEKCMPKFAQNNHYLEELGYIQFS